jgi:hypothetical protein
MDGGDSTAKVSIIIVIVLLTADSLFSLLGPDRVYPTDEMQRAFLANDFINLFMVALILLSILWFKPFDAVRARLIGVLFLPGAMFYITYNAVAYTVAFYPSAIFLPNLLLVILSVSIILHLLARTDTRPIQSRLKGVVRERLAGGVLITFGILFFLIAAVKWFGTLSGQAPIPRPEFAVKVADLLITPFWVAGGVMLWQRRSFGYLVGAGLLFQASMLFVSLLAFFIIQPILTPAPFLLTDFILILILGVICFIPLGIYFRAVLSTGRRQP